MVTPYKAVAGSYTPPPWLMVRLAATMGDSTADAAKAVLKRAGLRLTLAKELCAVAEVHLKAWHHRQFRRNARRLGYTPVDLSRLPAIPHYWQDESGATRKTESQIRAFPKGWQTPAVATYQPFQYKPNWPSGIAPLQVEVPLTQRREALTNKDFLAAYGEVFERHERGGWEVTLIADEAVRYYVKKYVAHKSKGHFAYGYKTSISVPRNWRTRVLKRGLAVHDKRVVLNALPVAAFKKIDGDAYGATWIRRVGAKNGVIETGFVVRRDGRVGFGDTLDNAIADLEKQLKKKK